MENEQAAEWLSQAAYIGIHRNNNSDPTWYDHKQENMYISKSNILVFRYYNGSDLPIAWNGTWTSEPWPNEFCVRLLTDGVWDASYCQSAQYICEKERVSIF